MNMTSNVRGQNGQPEGQERKAKGVKEGNVPREKEWSMLKATEVLKNKTIGKCPSDLVVRGWWQHQLKWREG